MAERFKPAEQDTEEIGKKKVSFSLIMPALKEIAETLANVRIKETSYMGVPLDLKIQKMVKLLSSCIALTLSESERRDMRLYGGRDIEIADLRKIGEDKYSADLVASNLPSDERIRHVQFTVNDANSLTITSFFAK